jgi:glycosyltransferase involved in cell wall biosynthesis
MVNSIIIPTRNRPKLLRRLVLSIVTEQKFGFEIIVVDSSDKEMRCPELADERDINYIVTDIQSAAVQRNLGLDNMKDGDYVFFLDDDVLPTRDYFVDCIEGLSKDGVTGISGIAKSRHESYQRGKPAGASGLFRVFFLLDSRRDGVLLKSGVNVPVRSSGEFAQEVDWLIGCSAWKKNFIGTTRFEEDFVGQSLAEDVIFSVRMRRKGTLVTDSRIILIHEESEIERPQRKEFWKMWVENRYRLVSVADFGLVGILSFWWANLGQLLILSISYITKKRYTKGSCSGLIGGCIEVIRTPR